MSAAGKVVLPMQAAGRRSTFFESEALDHLVAMMVEMAAQAWVTRERVFALEDVLSRRDPALLAELEAWEPDAGQAARLDGMREAMLAEIFRTLGVARPGPDEAAIAAMDECA